MTSAASSKSPITKITGPVGAGKSWRLVEIALQQVTQHGVPPQSVVILTQTANQTHRLRAYLKHLSQQAGIPAPPIPVLTVYRFLQQQTQHIPDISEAEAITVLAHLATATISDPTDTLYYTVRQPAFADALYQLFLSWAYKNPPAFKHSSREQVLLQTIGEQFQAVLETNQFQFGPAKQQPTTTAVYNTHPVSALFIDDAQELTEAQAHWFSELTLNHLILSGNIDTCLKTHYGAFPEFFAGLKSTEILATRFTSQPIPITQVLGDPIQEANKIATWIWNHVTHQHTPIQDSLTGAIRPCRWDDFVILTRHRGWDALIAEAMQQANIPINPAELPLNLQPVQTVFFDVFNLISNPSSDNADERVERLGQLTTLAENTLQDLLTNLQAAYEKQPGITQLAQHILEQLLTPTLNDNEYQQVHRLFLEPLSQLEQRLLQTTGQPLTLATALTRFDKLWTLPEQHWQNRFESTTPTVQLMRFHHAQGEQFPFVIMPFLTSGEFPKERLHGFENMMRTEHALENTSWLAQEKILFDYGVSRATHQVLLTTHLSNSLQGQLSNTVLPSPFFQALQPKPKHEQTTPSTSESDVEPVLYESSSLWASFPIQAEAPIFAPDELVPLSPTGITTWMTCPKQYAYKHLFKLPEVGSQAASLGVFVHRLMEVFNRGFPALPYTAQRLKTLAELLFSDDQAAILTAGFSKRDLQILQHLNAIERLDLKHQIMAAIDDLDQPQAFKNYFEHFKSMEAVESEKSLEQVQITGLQGCVMNGKIDAIIQSPNTNQQPVFDVIDYKFYGPNKKDTQPQRAQDNWQKILDPLETDEAGQPIFKNTDASPRDYQLPLYYLALSEDPKYAGKIRSLAMQIIRPGFGNDLEKGATRLTIDGHFVEEKKAGLLADLQQYIIEPLKNARTLPTTPGMHCRFCGYASICDQADESPDDKNSDGEGVSE